jgi:dTDP-4-amino-4,6-dideoxygalactose transaminase
VGTFGDAAAYSLGAGKMISGGHGGMLVAGDEVVHDLAMLTGHSKPRTRHDLRTMMLRRYAEFALGGNLRMSPFAAVLALDHAERLDDLSAHRLHNVAVLDAALEGLLDTIDVPPDRFNGSFFDMVYTLPASAPTAMRDVLVAELRRAGVPVTAPATRLLNRVIGSTCTGGPRLDHPLVRRLNELAENLPDAAELAHSIDLHDRMVSFPAGRLYAADGELAAWMALRARPVIARVLEST